MGISGGCDAVEQQEDSGYAVITPNTWFRDAEFSQLANASKTLQGQALAGVRIAHLDTGYDPNHRLKPEHLKTGLARNFVDERRERSAEDRDGTFHLSHGHGTGTIGLLAGGDLDGAPLGAAAGIEIVPVRVANIVALIRNSAIAKAFDYVHGLWGDPATQFDVVTMSMGGDPSSAWADARQRAL